MNTGKWGALICGVLALGIGAEGCNQSGRSRGGARAISDDVLPASERSLEPDPGATRTIEESDIVRIASGTLFVQNPARGLNVIDVSDPDLPRLRHQLTQLTGGRGELFLVDDDLLAVFGESATAPGNTEVVGVLAAASAPVEASRLYVPGELIGSRLVDGERLYLVTRDAASLRTWVTSIDAADRSGLREVQRLEVAGLGHEAHVSQRALYLAEEVQSGPGTLGTRLRVVDISDPTGSLRLRGQILLAGEPQGRFHMQEEGSRFRIVTWSGRDEGTNLYVLDLSDPDQPRIQGSLLGLARGEDLRATRFVGDRAYVVTFKPDVVTMRVIDPLFVISLADPSRPEVLGELEVPGWSDYVFPRGDRLLAVGRGGAIGETVAVSLFDVADPRQPQELRRVEFGVPGTATSEANSDFRGVAVVESGTLGAGALLAVPYTDNLHDDQGRCVPEHYVQLFDLRTDDVVLRGRYRQVGLVRRALPLGGRLYSVSDKTVAALDVGDRDVPRALATLESGDVAAIESCTPVFRPTPVIRTTGGCQVGAGAPRSAWVWLALLVAGLAAARPALAPRPGGPRTL